MGVAEELAEAVESAVTAGAAAAAEQATDEGRGGDSAATPLPSPPLLLPWSLALDPGLGFSKTRGQNLSLLARTEALRGALPPQFRAMPVLVGASRKGFLGGSGGGEARAASEEDGGGGGGGEVPSPLHPRDAATFASSAIAAAHGADLLRVHEVSRNREAAGVGASVRWSRAEEVS